MDWTTVITTILAALIPTGGVAALFTVRERKTELTLNNMAKINEQWSSFSERDELRRKELKDDLERKDRKIDELYSEISKLRNALDEERTELARASMMRCVRIRCVDRDPPYGTTKLNVSDGNNQQAL